jgi:hypothetical protein
VVKQSTHNTEIEGLNPAAGFERDKVVKRNIRYA